MARSWQQVVQEIESETERVWIEEPLEIRKLRVGISDTGAGTGGQIFSVILNLNGETRSFAVRGCFHLIKNADDQSVSLEALKQRTRDFLPNNAGTIEYLGISGYKRFSEDILDVLEDIRTKEEYKSLIGALYAYANRMMFWVHEITPHGLGSFYPRWDEEKIDRIRGCMGKIRL